VPRVNEKIEPALTAAEWAAQGGPSFSAKGADSGIDEMEECPFAGTEDGVVFVGYRANYVRLIDPASIAALAAVCLAALPDGHPMKITRDRVEDMILAASLLPDNRPHLAAELRSTAAMLAALTPPEGA
jgi:hypothetical protein